MKVASDRNYETKKVENLKYRELLKFIETINLVMLT
jgi:hypothetical protein